MKSNLRCRVLDTFLRKSNKYVPRENKKQTNVASKSILCCHEKQTNIKVHIFWEGHKILRNLHQLLVLCNASQIICGDFEKCCGLLRIYEL